jgi:hypothetical protein
MGYRRMIWTWPCGDNNWVLYSLAKSSPIDLNQSLPKKRPSFLMLFAPQSRDARRNCKKSGEI